MATLSARIHPLVAAAAVSVILVSVLGVAALTGHLPGAHGTTHESSATTAAISPTVPAATPVGTPTEISATQVPPPPPSGSMTAQNPQLPNAPLSNYHTTQLCESCGTVESIRTLQHQAQASGVGAVAGALLGGVVGNRFGGGNGRALSTVAGAVGGGLAGNEIEKSRRRTITYQVAVKMENGKIRNFYYNNKPAWNIGDPVKAVHGALVARG